MNNIYRIADKNIRISSLFSFIHVYCDEYKTDGEPDFEVEITEADLKAECKAVKADIMGGWVEVSAVYRKIAEIMPKYDTFMLHGSAISVDGEGYLFSAKSGTGKSTHTKLWCKLLGDRAIMVNDDKPFIRVTGGEARIYGTPYSGKEGLNTNISVPLRAICILERSETNRIRQVDFSDVYPVLVQQAYHPSDREMFDRTLELLDRLSQHVRFNRLSCNKELEAAEVSYSAMKGRNRTMRLKNEFLTHTSGDEAYLVPSGRVEFRGLVKGNELLGEVIGLLKTDTTEAEIVKALRSKYNAPSETIESDVKRAVEVMRSVGALIE